MPIPQLSHRQRLLLYLTVAIMPEFITWVTLQWDLTPRGLIIMLSKLTLAAATTSRAFYDHGGKLPEPEQPVQPPAAQPPTTQPPVV